MQNKMNVEISTPTLVKVFLFIALFYFLFLARDIIALLFIVLILTAALRPIVTSWAKVIKRIPAVIILLAILVGLISFITYIIIPPVASQIRQLINDLPDYFSRYAFLHSLTPYIKEGTKSISNNIGGITGSLVTFTAGVFGGIIAFLSAIIMTVYLLLDEKNTKAFLINLIPSNQQESVSLLLKKIVQKIGDWFRGQIILCIAIGLLFFIGLSILRVPYALTLAVIAGILELIPTIGPIITGILAAIIALQVSPLIALLTVVLFIVIQQLENSILVPKIMQKAVGLSPVIVILAVLTGAKVFGVVGAILAVPIAASLYVVVQEWPQIRATFNR